jgi:hypothetical protein
MKFINGQLSLDSSLTGTTALFTSGMTINGLTLLRGSGTTSGTTAILIQSSTGGTGSVISNTGNYGINVDIPLANFHSRGFYNELYFQSPTTNQGRHDISFGFGGTGRQVRLIASATGGSGNGNLYIATASGDVAVATTANANAVFQTAGNTFYKTFSLDQSTLTSGNGLYLAGNQQNTITNGIYFRYSETRVAILSKPTGGSGYADFRIAIVPQGGSGNNPPQESDTKFMITNNTTNVLVNTTTDLGFKLSVSGSTLLRGSGTTSASYALATQNSSGGTTVVVNDAGNMLIGTTTDAGYMLDVNGTAKFTGTVSMAGGTIVANTYTAGGLSLSVTNGGHYSSRAIYAYSGNIGVTGESSLGAGPNGTNSSGVYAKMPVSPIGVSFTDSDGVFNTTYKPIGLLSERAIITTGGTSSNMTNGVMLQVMGSTLLTSSVISNSIPATPNTAYGLYIKNTLVATNNNNSLIGLDIQPTFTPGSYTGLTQLALRVSGGTQIIGSGSTGTTLSVFSVDGSSGRLFDVSDDLSSTLFSVNTIAGLPVIEAFANSSVVLGKYGQNTLVVSGTSVGIGIPNPTSKLHVSGTGYFTSSLIVGNYTGTTNNENTLNVYPPIAGGTGEGGQILLAASGGIYTTASMLDTWQNNFRILKGSNASGSTDTVLTINLQTNNATFAGSVTATSFSGLPNTWLYATRNSSQTIGSGTWADRDVVFNSYSSNNFTYNSSTGVATLKANKTYRITSMVAWSAAAVYTFRIRIYNQTTSSFVGPTTEMIQSTNGTNNFSNGTLDYIFAVGGSDTDITIRTTSDTTALTGEYIRGDLNTQLIIQQIA